MAINKKRHTQKGCAFFSFLVEDWTGICLRQSFTCNEERVRKKGEGFVCLRVRSVMKGIAKTGRHSEENAGLSP
jgi:hypothetical protein